MDGVVSCVQGTPEIIVSSIKGEKLVSAGSYVGRVSTLLELEEEEVADEDWTLDRLRSEIKLGSTLEEQQKNVVYDMLLTAKAVMNRSEGDVAKANVAPHVIELTDNNPDWDKTEEIF